MLVGDEAAKGQALKVKWTGKGHTALPVPLYAFGPGALGLAGVHDNTDIAKTIATLLGMKDFPKQTGR